MNFKSKCTSPFLAREEEKDSEDAADAADAASEKDSGHTKVAVKAAPGAIGTQSATQALLNRLRQGYVPLDKSALSLVNNTLELLHDFAALLRARERLLSLSQNKSLNVILQARISAMIGVLNLFLDPKL